MGVKFFKINTDCRTQSDYKRLISQIDAYINSLIAAKINSTSVNSGVSEYELDTGQTKVRKRFLSPKEFTAEITEWENLRQFYLNRMNGTSGRYRLMNERNFK